jgi:glycosyltransferase involved in cell wall biosynthesis
MTPRRLRVLHVLPWVTAGGVERRRLQLARGLDPARFEQHVLCKQARPPLSDAIVAAGAPLHIIEGAWHPGDLDALGRALQLVEDLQPDIIHGAVFEGMTFAALLGYLARVPAVIIEETGSSPHRSARGDLLVSALSAISHKTVAISSYVGRYLDKRSRLSPDKLTVITNGVSFPAALDAAARAALRAQWGLSDAHVVFGSAGRVYDDIKRFSDLIRALAHLDAPHARLVIAGDGPDLPALRTLAASLNIQDKVIFLGYVSEMSQVYGCLDVFALVSLNEGFGLVLPEAMSVALPTIGTRVDAIPDIIDEGVTGLLVPPSSPRAIADAMLWMLTHPAERQQMGEAGRKRAYERFSEARYVEDVKSLYEHVISNKERQ